MTSIGLQVLRRGVGLEAHGKRLNEKFRQARHEMALEVERRAKLYAPVNKGRLRGSIESGMDGEVAFVRTNVEYASFQEFGTLRTGQITDPGPTPEWYQHGTAAGGVPAQPYLRPAFYQVTGTTASVMRRAASTA